MGRYRAPTERDYEYRPAFATLCVGPRPAVASDIGNLRAEHRPFGVAADLRVRGNSKEPEIHEGDRFIVDTARRVPATGERFVLWDGEGLVVKRIETVRSNGRPRLRLKSANPDYADYACLAGDAHIVGKVVWTLRRV